MAVFRRMMTVFGLPTTFERVSINGKNHTFF